jgi:PAS domain S-box
MKKQWNQSEKNELHPLRRRAEVLLSEREKSSDELSNPDAQSLIRELQVHQIELEMQNEELRRAQIELEESRNRYAELYDFAPVGYFTLDKKSMIVEVNLTGAALLGIERQYLIRQQLFRYVARESYDVFHFYIKRLLESATQQTCELKMLKKDRTTFYAQLEGVAAFDSWNGELSYLKLAMFDIAARKRAE